MKKSQSGYDYGKCHVCGEHMKEQRVKQEFWIRGKLLIIDDVPAGVCPRCGERVVKADIGRSLAALIEDPKRLQRARRISVPVIPFTKAVA